MINTLDTPVLSSIATDALAALPVTQMTTYVRQHPGGVLLAAAGLGLVAALLIRALNPPPPRNSAMRLLEDLRHRLTDLADPAYARVSHLVEEGAHAASKGVERKFGKLGREFRNLFH